MALKSFFCAEGCDNGQRFSLISGLIYVGLILTGILSTGALALYLVGFLLAPVFLLSALRRLRDAGKQRMWILLPVTAYLLVLITLANQGSGLLLISFILFSVIATAYLAIFPAVKGLKYSQGYAGPVAIRPSRSTTLAAKANRSRVEPTLNMNAATPMINEQTTLYDEHACSQKPSAQPLQDTRGSTGHRSESKPASLSSVMQQWLPWIQQHQTPVFIGALAMVLFMLALSIYALSSSAESTAVKEDVPLAPKITVVRESTQLPDGFSLALEKNVLIVRWLGEDSGEPGTLWSQASAIGDKTCANLTFNNGAKYRPLVVDLMPDTAIEARFSPLDTAAIITDMARRGSVNLCGYRFSLKGSQLALGRVPAFADYL